MPEAAKAAARLGANTPGYWMNETSGVLRPAVEAYLNRSDMTPGDLGAMRAYLRQWIAAPVWRGSAIDTLRQTVDEIIDRPSLEHWLDVAVECGVDPL